MYSAKQSGHAKLKIYDTKLRELAVTKLEIEEDLRKALREGELRVAYQPVVDLATRDVVGYEALVRWSHPLRGELLPEEFIAIAEQANLVVPIGSLVAHEACDFLARHPSFTGTVFVNASPKQLGTAGPSRAPSRPRSATSDIAPERVCVEITESGMVRTSRAADSDLDSIHELGHPIILDDFGTGSGALATILEKPVVRYQTLGSLHATPRRRCYGRQDEPRHRPPRQRPRAHGGNQGPRDRGAARHRDRPRVEDRARATSSGTPCPRRSSDSPRPRTPPRSDDAGFRPARDVPIECVGAERRPSRSHPRGVSNGPWR